MASGFDHHEISHEDSNRAKSLPPVRQDVKMKKFAHGEPTLSRLGYQRGARKRDRDRRAAWASSSGREARFRLGGSDAAPLR